VLKFIHLIERTELVSEETSVTVFIAVRRAEIVGKIIQEQREIVKERYMENTSKAIRQGEY
jgi:hypothetical protein